MGKKVNLSIAFLIVMFLALGTQAAAISSREGWPEPEIGEQSEAPAELEPSKDYVADEVIVALKKGASKSKIKSVNAKFKTKTKSEIPQIGAYVLKVPKGKSAVGLKKSFKKITDLRYAELNYRVEPSLEPNDPLWPTSGSWGQPFDDLWGLKTIEADEAWQGSTGSSSVVVGVVDTGLDDTHEDIQQNVWHNPGETGGGKESNGIDDDGNGYIDDWKGWDFEVHRGDNDPEDNHGHGTHVSGTVGAVGNNEIGVVGVNWNVKIMALKFMDVDGGYAIDAAEALIYAADNGAAITNHSWGPGHPVDPYFIPEYLRDAIAYATSKGSITVSSAGNGSRDVSTGYPANDPNVIAVGATDYLDNLAFFSNWGSDIDVVAPGVDILSLKASGVFAWGPVVASDYFVSSGTSMASPHVAGLAALVLSVNPNRTNEEVRQILRESATDLGAPGKDDYFGYGLINAKNTLDHQLVGWFKNMQPTPGSFVSDAAPRVSATLDENSNPDTATIQLSVDGLIKSHSYEASTKEIYYQVESPLSEEAHTVEISLQDNSGVPIDDSWSFTVDTIVPAAPTDLTGTLQSDGIDLNWAGSIDVSNGEKYEIERSVDGIDFAVVGTSEVASYSDSELLGGTTQYFYRVRSTDKAQNASAYSNVVTVAVEADPPVTVADLSATSGENSWYISRVIVTLSASDAETGVREIKYSINGGNWSTYTSEFDIASERENTLEYYAIDNYGNTEVTKTEIVKVDMSAPEGDVSINNGAPYTNARDVTLDFSSVSDNVSGLDQMMISEDAAFAGANWQDFQQSVPFTLSAGDGEKKVYVRFIDIAGNTDTNANLYSDDLSTAIYKDDFHSTAVWDTAAGEVRLPVYDGYWLRQEGWDATLQIFFGNRSAAPTLADLDDDGDNDLLVGEYSGESYAYRNSGDSTSPTWTRESDWDLPADISRFPRPNLGDLDNDGDFDILLGNSSPKIIAYKNTGNEVFPVWAREESWDFWPAPTNPHKSPALADLDGDSDLDLLVGEQSGAVSGYRNTGDATSPLWTREPAWDGPTVSTYSAPALADLDRDGDFDLIAGHHGGTSHQAYMNTGDGASPIWTRETTWDVESVGQFWKLPAFADLDGDDDADLTIGHDDRMYAFENTSDSPTVHDRSAMAQSLTVDDTDERIDNATLDATETLNGQTIDYQLSRDGGLTWEDVSKGVEHTFISSFSPLNSDLRWRATLGTEKSSITPVLTGVSVMYNEQYSGKQAQVILDTEMPTLPTDLTPELIGTQVNLTWQPSTDTLSGIKDYEVEKSTDGAVFTNIGSSTETSYSDTISAAGTYYYRVRAFDNALNVSGYSNVVQVEVLPDSTAPDTQANISGTLGENGWYQSAATIEISSSDTGSGVEEIEYRIDGASWITYTSEFLISLEGESALEYYAEDNFGNVEAVKSEIVKVDRSAPVGSILIDSDATYTNSTNVTLDISSASDGVSGLGKVMFSEDENFTGAAWQDYQPSMLFTLSDGDGEKTVYVKFKDLAGNTNTNSFTDSFNTTDYMDTANTTAVWDTVAGEIKLRSDEEVWSRQAGWEEGVVMPSFQAAPALADLDDDGDRDLLIGQHNGKSFAYKNTGDMSSPVWTREPEWDVADLGERASPAIADLDADGDYDLLVGEYYQGIKAFENTGGKAAPVWSAREEWDVDDVFVRYESPTIADLDGDGDNDLLVGEFHGNTYAYKNTGDSSSPIWAREVSWDAPDAGDFASPALADMDKDGDYDLLVGSYNVLGRAFMNSGDGTSPIWTRDPTWDAPSVLPPGQSYDCEPAFADLDGDKDRDLLIGVNSLIYAFENTVSASAQSLTIDTTEQIITTAAPEATQVFDGQSISYELSRDGGTTWESVENTVEHTFVSTVAEKSDLRWRATLVGNAGSTPVIEAITINYENATEYDTIILDANPPPAPIIESSTHPDPAEWYSSNDPAFNWAEPADASGIEGYSFVLDQNPSTIPNEAIDTSDTATAFTDVSEGTSYFHLRAEDKAGNWGEAGHFRINVDSATAPSIPQNVKITPTDVDAAILSWDASTDSEGSGVAGYKVFDTKTGVEVADVATTSHTLSSLAAGNYSYYVVAYDMAGNVSERSRFASVRLPVSFSWQSVDILGSTFAANPAGATATASFIFEGDAVSINYGCGLNTGIFEVSIDGAVVDTLDAYCSPPDFSAKKTYATVPGGHEVVVRPTGNTNPSSSYYWTLINSFEVQGEAYEEDDGIAYTWQTVEIPPGSGNTFSANPAGATAYASFTYAGDNVSLNYGCGLNTGIFDVQIDGAVTETVDAYCSPPDFSAKKTYPTAPLGTHTITVRPTGNNNPSSSYYWTLIDSFETSGSTYQAQALPKSDAEELSIPESKLSKLIQKLPKPIRDRIEKRLEAAGGITSADTIPLLNSEKLTRLLERLEGKRDEE